MKQEAIPMTTTPIATRRPFGKWAISSAAALGVALFMAGCKTKTPTAILDTRGTVVPSPYFDPGKSDLSKPRSANNSSNNSAMNWSPAPSNQSTTSSASIVPMAPSSQTYEISSSAIAPMTPYVPATPSAVVDDGGSSVTFSPGAGSTAPADMTSLPPLVKDDAVSLRAVTSEALPVSDGEAVTYKVQKGDSLWKIGKLYGLSSAEIASANAIKVDSKLKIGQSLTIPPGGKLSDSNSLAMTAIAKSSTSTSPSSSSMPSLRAVTSEPSTTVSREAIPASGTYAVQKGDNLWKIGMKYNLTLTTIQGLNPNAGDNLKIGETIYLTESAARKGGITMSAVSPTHSKTATKSSSKSETAGTSSAPALMSRTKTTDSTPLKGTQAVPADGQYTVQKNDSLWLIERKFGVPMATIKDLNHLKDNRLAVGQMLVLRDGVVPTVSAPTKVEMTYTGAVPADGLVIGVKPSTPSMAAATTPVNPANLTTFEHHLEPTDNLAGIADMYGITTTSILEANPTLKGADDLKNHKVINVPVPDIGGGN